MVSETETRIVCIECFQDAYLSASAKSLGERDTCSFCSKTDICVGLTDLAEWVHEVLQQHFRPLELSIWGIERHPKPEGKRLVNWIEEIALCKSEIARAVSSYLSDYYNPIADSEEIFRYEEEELYELRPARSFQHEMAWDDFVLKVKTRARYFDPKIEEILTDIFEGVHKLRSAKGNAVIREVGPDSDFPIYRGRYASSDGQLRIYLEDPYNQLGPPPGGRAAAGRMNAYGVPVFYGATNPDVCLSEIRAPVGSQVVVACFKVLRPLKLLDLPVLEDALDEFGSFCDPRFAEKRSRVEFMKSLNERISQPVMPGEEALEYVPTQIVAAYLEHKLRPQIDGIIYRSTQYDGDGFNIVLLHHASVVEELPYKDFKLSLGASPTSISAVPLAEEEVETEWSPFSSRRPPPWIDDRVPALAIDVESINIHKVSGVRLDAWGSPTEFRVRCPK